MLQTVIIATKGALSFVSLISRDGSVGEERQTKRQPSQQLGQLPLLSSTIVYTGVVMASARITFGSHSHLNRLRFEFSLFDCVNLFELVDIISFYH